MSKPFFYRITAADFLAAIVTVPECDRASWVLSLALDMVTADVDTAKSQFAIDIITEAGEFKQRKAEAGRKGGQAKASSAKAVPSSAIAKPSTPLASNSNSNRSSTVTEPKPLKTVCRFTPPSVHEVAEYCRERNKGVDAERWIDHYTSNGWKVGKNTMKDWKAAVRTWERNSIDNNSKQPNKSNTSRAIDALLGEQHGMDERGNHEATVIIDVTPVGFLT